MVMVGERGGNDNDSDEEREEAEIVHSEDRLVS